MSEVGTQLLSDGDDDNKKATGIGGVNQLYGGNFKEWQKQMSEMFITKDRPTQAYPSISHVDEYGTTHYYKSNLGDIRDIFKNINGDLDSRMPDSLDISVGRLYACLEKLCQPFRLLDLPTELRIKIHENVVRSDWQVEVESRMRDKLPALAQASQQLRREVLPVYFISNVFALYEVYDDSNTLSVGQATAAAIPAWQHEVLRSNAKHLRRVEITVSASRDELQPDGSIRDDYTDTVLVLRFAKNPGLWIETAQDMYDESKKRLEEMVALAESE